MLELGRRGYGLRVTGTAAEALTLARTWAPSLMLLDLGLPDRDGAEMLRDMRARGDALPVICLTARDQQIDRIGGSARRRGRLHRQALRPGRARCAHSRRAAPLRARGSAGARAGRAASLLRPGARAGQREAAGAHAARAARAASPAQECGPRGDQSAAHGNACRVERRHRRQDRSKSTSTAFAARSRATAWRSSPCAASVTCCGSFRQSHRWSKRCRRRRACGDAWRRSLRCRCWSCSPSTAPSRTGRCATTRTMSTIAGSTIRCTVSPGKSGCPTSAPR